MKIVYNSQIFQWQEYGGISRYFANLIQRVACEEQVVVLASLSINKYLTELPQDLVKGIALPWRTPRGARILENIGSAIDRMVLPGIAPDILHETYYAYRSVGPASMPTVLTVHDMTHERFKDYFSNKDDTINRKKAAVSRASHVICISENTRRDLIELHDVDPEKVSVIYQGYEGLNGRVDSGYGVLTEEQSRPYILYVGDRSEYKNCKSLLRAYASSTWLRDNFRIVCFGGGPFRTDELDLLQKLEIKSDQIAQMGGGDDVLASYYKNAAAFVYPSLYEGFGIPPLEAMALGCPVICSNTSSIPEVVGDAGEYFDPLEIESIRTSIEKVLQSSESRNELVQRGYSQCKEYSWDRCASETLEIYRRLIN
jgi:glycosyltransferase involved in cell wall biosynthesis